MLIPLFAAIGFGTPSRRQHFVVCFFLLLSCSLASCGKKKSFEVTGFQPMANVKIQQDTAFLEFEMDSDFINGLCLPSSLSKQEYFQIRFEIKNMGSEPKSFQYKVYYQNESYKHPEALLDPETEAPIYNILSANNFYGSWENSDVYFKSTPVIPADGLTHTVIDSIRIVGNPRNEAMYLGAPANNSAITDEQIAQLRSSIVNSPEWIGQVEAKAKGNNKTLEEQMDDDIFWVLKDVANKGEENNRWKRNPRAGNYSFLLVVAEEVDISTIPNTISDIGLKDSTLSAYINPYFYFLHNEDCNENINCQLASSVLNAKAVLKPSSGIYIDPFEVKKKKMDESFMNDVCGYGDHLFTTAHFSQFFTNVNLHYQVTNIPEIYDVVGDTYTKDMYHENVNKYSEEDLIPLFVSNTNIPGKAVNIDHEKGAIHIANSHTENLENARKENVGVKSRVGFTYGTYTAKIQFPKILNSENVWNGLTCAFWLIYQDDAPWNVRSASKNGYLDADNRRVPLTNYSEIDIEIVKTSKHWPETSYPNVAQVPIDSAINGNVIVTCTNWDMASQDPSGFHTGARDYEYGGQSFTSHRWDHGYRAVSAKYEYPHDRTLGDILYYQIEWQPTYIIWRLGASKEDMQVIGYMDSTFTTIADNQMVPVVSQEFHDSKWWPLAPYDQNYIPFPAVDLSGYIYEITVE